MKKKKVKEKKSFLGFITKILVVITVIAFIMAGFRIKENSQRYTYGYSISDYLWNLKNNRFGEVYLTALNDMERDKTYSAEVAECRALGFYYEQSVLEKAYREAGQNDKADAIAEKKAAYAQELGSISSKAKEVDDILGE